MTRYVLRSAGAGVAVVSLLVVTGCNGGAAGPGRANTASAMRPGPGSGTAGPTGSAIWPGRVPAYSNRPVLSGHAASLVVRDGETVIGSGSVEAFPGEPVRLCVLDDPWGEPRKPCKGVKLIGFDLTRLSHRIMTDGILDGVATIVGTYHHGTLTVTAQGPSALDPKPVRVQFVPCTPPNGGWTHNNYGSDTSFSPISVDLSAARHYQRTHPADIVNLAALRASPSSVVAYVLTRGDPTSVRAALSKLYPNELCVTKSRITSAQLTAVQSALQSELVSMPGADGLPAWISLGSAGELGPEAQLAVPVEISIMTPRLAMLLDSQPAGAVQVTTILRPLNAH